MTNPNTKLFALIVLIALTSIGCARRTTSVPDSLRASIEAQPEASSVSPDLTVERWTRVDASPECVYETLTDIDAWTNWEPAIDETRWVEGETFEVGNVFYQKIGDMEFHAQIVDAVPGKLIRWHGQDPEGGGVLGAHAYMILPDGDGSIVVNREVFDAWYVRPLGWFTDLGIGDQFEEAVVGLAAHAPQRCGNQSTATASR